MDDPIDEDRQLRSNLVALGPAALRQLRGVLTWPQPWRDALSLLLCQAPSRRKTLASHHASCRLRHRSASHEESHLSAQPVAAPPPDAEARIESVSDYR